MTHQPYAPEASSMLRHARRALLVIGGAFVWWLVVLSGGSAQADDHATQSDDGHLAVAPVVHTAKSELTTRAHRAATTTTETLRSTPHRVTGTVSAPTAHAPEPVRTTVVKLTEALDPALTTTATTLADTVDRTVGNVQAVVDPVLQGAGAQPATTSVSITANATRHEASGSRGRDHARSTTIPVSSTDQPAATRVQPAGQAPDRERGLPGPTAPALPAPSASGGSTNGTALLALAALIPPATRRLRRRRRDDSVPFGPAYQPDSSPD